MGGDQMEDMDTSDSPCCWYYLAFCGNWHQFEDDSDKLFSSQELEYYYSKHSRGTLNKASGSGICKVDFSEMKLVDATNREHNLKRGYVKTRSCSCYVTAPVLWAEGNGNCPYQLITLHESSPEYQTVAAYVSNQGLLGRTIISIARMQNLDLWHFYCRKMKQLMRLHQRDDIEVKRLFHGTHTDNIEAICKYNFDLRMAGKHGSAYGKGIYFSKHASYSIRYCRSSNGTHLTMILALIIVGRSTVGKSNFLKPDHDSLENRHDSCVDRDNDPNIFVIFDPNQIYPEYLIQFT